MRKKQCRRCKISKKIDQFNRGPCRSDGFHSYCRECQRAYDLERYVRLTPESRKAMFDKKAARKAAIRKEIEAIKASPCKDCGKTFPPYVMDFDHRDPSTKEFDIATAHRHGLSLERILAEIAKCDVICSNCHRIRTHKDTYRSVA